MVADILDKLDVEKPESAAVLTDHDTVDLSDSIHQAAASPSLYGESVFDHTAMSRLSPASAVK